MFEFLFEVSVGYLYRFVDCGISLVIHSNEN